MATGVAFLVRIRRRTWARQPQSLLRTRRAIEVTGGCKPWLDHFYLSHGVGTDAAEQPLIGTDLGAAFDGSIVLAPGMLCVLEPVIWDDGFGGYRSEEIVAVTDSGYQKLSSYGYAPYQDTMGGA